MSVTDTALKIGQFKDVVGRFCSGLTIVTAMSEHGPIGMTCQSFFSVSLDPPLVSFSPSKSSTSYPSIRAARRFAINILSEAQGSLARQFARSGTDKWSGVDWVYSDAMNPLIADSLAAIECDFEVEHEAGDHYLVLGRVIAMMHEPTLRPLLFYRSDFSTLAAEPSEVTPEPAARIR